MAHVERSSGTLGSGGAEKPAEPAEMVVVFLLENFKGTKQLPGHWRKRKERWMMKRVLLTMSLVVLAGMVPIASAMDINPPTLWQRGEPGSTYQRWEFDTDDTTPMPDDYFNPYGDPDLTVIPIGPWENTWGGLPGVWPLSGLITVDIPNNPVENEFKWVQIQLTWAGEVNHANATPCISVTAKDAAGQPIASEFITLLNTTDTLLEKTNVAGAGEYWHHTTCLFQITPNPFEETIIIGSAIMADELVIDTICIPEPATMSLLVIGAACLLGKRHRHR